ncbi:MAG: hypothetical protein KKH73_00400 [Actinobacteria bacterium]|nr:hypothetical protein [Actinomycetota bacterium]
MGKRGSRGAWRWSAAISVALLVVILVGAVGLQYSLDDSPVIQASWDESSPFDTARSFLDILGGVRETLAAYLWTKTDTIFHDYLGHTLKNEEAIVSYHWLITRLDPHFVMPFYFASWLLCSFDRVNEGLDLAIEGVRYNPDSSQLQENLASIYFYFKKDAAKARYHLLKAIRLSSDVEDKRIFSNFLKVVDAVIAGEKEIPEVGNIHDVEGFDEHTHGEDEYCPECEHNR